MLDRAGLFAEATRNTYVLTREAARPKESSLPSAPLADTPDIDFSFSELKYLFECLYQFKLRFPYGFDSPLQQELGYGISLQPPSAPSPGTRRAKLGQPFTRWSIRTF